MSSGTFFNLGCQCCKMFELLSLEKSKSIFQEHTLNGNFKPKQRWTTENSKNLGKTRKMNFIESQYCQQTVIETTIARDSASQPQSRNQLRGPLLSFIVTLQTIKYSPIFVLFFGSRTKRRAGAKRWDPSVMILDVSYEEITILFQFCGVFGFIKSCWFVGCTYQMLEIVPGYKVKSITYDKYNSVNNWVAEQSGF